MSLASEYKMRSQIWCVLPDKNGLRPGGAGKQEVFKMLFTLLCHIRSKKPEKSKFVSYNNTRLQAAQMAGLETIAERVES